MEGDDKCGGLAKMLDLLDSDVVMAPDAISASNSLLSRVLKSSAGSWFASRSWLGPTPGDWCAPPGGDETRCWLSKLDWVAGRSI